MLKKNQLVELTVTGVTGEGAGVARYVSEAVPAPGFVMFIPGTAIGDRLICRIVKVQKSHAFGKIEELLEPSPDRVEHTDCPAYGRCGGCNWRHVTYEAECRYKQNWVQDTIRRVGGIDAPVLPLIGGDSPDHYRNKAQFPVAPSAEGPVIGFFAPRSHRIVPCKDCKLQPEGYAAVLDAVEGWMVDNAVPAYDETAHSGLVRHVYIRQAAVTGEMMVCIVCTERKIPAEDDLVARLIQAAPQMISLSVNVNSERTNVILGKRTVILWGADSIVDRLCGLHFRLSPHSFYQVNHAQTEKLYRLAAQAAALTGKETLLDLYCGTGTIGLSMAHTAGAVIGVEVVEAAVRDAKKNATANRIRNARFICADAAAAAAQLATEGIRPDVVILDPPRKGCSPDLIDTVAGMAPRRVVYVSCDPATLARDLKLFAERGYHTQWVQPVDLFPRTAHCENVACLTKER
ncbi:MAG: 23S rRNA (uracil(1939)-C(5))-methyltransferase RlmD [Clostridia bacterium]|nr:23S rRNA (uracil(1939)-C(5))-methyltransferase RlmD [Clostridia bacterium]